MTNKAKVGRAWIVTYQSCSQNKHLNNKILSVLKWQKSSEQIYEHIIQLYVDNHLDPTERICFLHEKSTDGLVYKPSIRKANNNTYIVTIGHDPILEARQVKNLKITDGKWNWEEI